MGEEEAKANMLGQTIAATASEPQTEALPVFPNPPQVAEVLKPVPAPIPPVPEPSFNFLQESQIDLESPHMDPAVVMVPSNQILRSGRGNLRAFRIGMKRRKTIGGEEIEEGEEEEEVVGEDLEEGTVAIAGEEAIEGEREATEEEIEEETTESMMIEERIGEMIESMKIEVIGHEEGTEVAVRTEDEVVIEAVEALREEEEAKEAEVKMGTVIRKHIINFCFKPLRTNLRN